MSIKIHAFYDFDSLAQTFVFVHHTGKATVFANYDCWESDKPVLRTVRAVDYSIFPGNQLTGKPMLSIEVEGVEPFYQGVDKHEQFVADGLFDCYLAIWTGEGRVSEAAAFGSNSSTPLSGWASRIVSRPSVTDVPVRLEDEGIYVGRRSGARDALLEKYSFVLNYRTGELLKDWTAQDQAIMTS